MGMFDDFYFTEECAPRCPEGHPITYFQTKSLECQLHHYYVVKSQLFLPQEEDSSTKKLGPYSSWDTVDALKASKSRDGWDIVDTYLVLRNEVHAKPALLTATAYAYNGCAQCEGVYFYNDSTWSGHLEEKKRTYEFELVFESGRLVKATPQNNMTRAEFRQKLEKQGCIMLEDDNPIVVAHKMQEEGRIR